MNQYKKLFLVPPGIIYLNCANMSPLLATAKTAALSGLEARATPWALTRIEWFDDAETLRELAAGIFQTSGNNVALIPSASYGLAAAAKNCVPERGKTIIVLDKEFPSNYYVWEEMAAAHGLQLICIRQENNRSLTASVLEKISADTGLVAIPNCHWSTGSIIDLQKISDAAKSVGAFFILDLSQSLGVLPVSIDSLQPDFAVSVGYKWLLGPYGLGYMYVAPRWHKEGSPLEYSWLIKKGSDDFTGLSNYVAEYRQGARRFDMGEFPQINTLPMAIAGLQQVQAWGPAFIQAQLKRLTNRIQEYKKSKGWFNEYALPAGHLTAIPVNGNDIALLAKKLQEQKIYISFRGTGIRVAPHLHNEESDIDALLACLP